MTAASAPIKIYLKTTRPFCLKLRILMTEAGIADRAEFVVFAEGEETHQALRAWMQAAGQEPNSPAAEFKPGTLSAGSDALIARFAKETDVETRQLPLLNY